VNWKVNWLENESVPVYLSHALQVVGSVSQWTGENDITEYTRDATMILCDVMIVDVDVRYRYRRQDVMQTLLMSSDEDSESNADSSDTDDSSTDIKSL